MKPLHLLIAFLLGSGAQISAEPGKPNVLFVLTDDLGWGDLSC
jgi:hypothetical protein